MTGPLTGEWSLTQVSTRPGQDHGTGSSGIAVQDTQAAIMQYEGNPHRAGGGDAPQFPDHLL